MKTIEQAQTEYELTQLENLGRYLFSEMPKDIEARKAILRELYWDVNGFRVANRITPLPSLEQFGL